MKEGKNNEEKGKEIEYEQRIRLANEKAYEWQKWRQMSQTEKENLKHKLKIQQQKKTIAEESQNRGSEPVWRH